MGDVSKLIRLPREAADALRDRADETGVSEMAVIRQALRSIGIDAPEPVRGKAPEGWVPKQGDLVRIVPPRWLTGAVRDAVVTASDNGGVVVDGQIYRQIRGGAWVCRTANHSRLERVEG